MAGGLLGLGQGWLFGVLSVLLEPTEAAEVSGALLHGAGIGLGGLAACAMLSMVAAAFSQRAA